MKYIALLLSIAGILLFVFSNSSSISFSTDVLGTYEESQRQEVPETIPAVLFVQGYKYEIDVPLGSTVYDVMNALERVSQFRFRGRNFQGMGFFVEEINGISQDHSRDAYWLYSINGQKSQVGVSQYKLQPGDIISWSYEKEE